MIYVTFEVIDWDRKFKIAVECETIGEANEVAADARSTDGVKNIRFNRCGRLGKRNVFDIQKYFTYKIWDAWYK